MHEWIATNFLNLLTVIGSVIAACAALWNVHLTRTQLRLHHNAEMSKNLPVIHAIIGGEIDNWIWVTVTVNTRDLGIFIETVHMRSRNNPMMVQFAYGDLIDSGIKRIYSTTDFKSAEESFELMGEIRSNSKFRFCFWYHLEPPVRTRFSKLRTWINKNENSDSIFVSLLSMDNQSQRTEMDVAIKAKARKSSATP